MDSSSYSPSRAVPMPADIDLEDRLVGSLTARQLVILGAAGVGLWLLQRTLGAWSLLAFAVLAIPLAAAAVAVALGRRDGVSLDRYLWALGRHLTGTRPHPTPDRDRPETLSTPAAAFTAAAEAGGRGGWWARPRQPLGRGVLAAREVAPAPYGGVVDLGRGGLGMLAVASTVSWGLRNGGEQDAMVAGLARWLHALSAPTQILVRAMPLDLSGNITTLQAAAAGGLGHPALDQAAADYAAYLAELAATRDLLCRQVVLVFREPNPPGTAPTSEQAQARRDRAALTRLARRLAEASDLLAPAGITVTPLDADQAALILHTTTNPYPDHTPAPGQPDPAGPEPDQPPAGPDTVRTVRIGGHSWFPMPDGPAGRWTP